MRRIVPSDSDVNDDALKRRQLDLQAPCSFADVSEVCEGTSLEQRRCHMDISASVLSVQTPVLI